MFREFPATIILRELSYNDLLPAILFRSSRKQCDADVEKLGSLEQAKINHELQDKLKSSIDEVIVKYGLDQSVVFNHPQYKALVATAVGAHHAGQLLVWRLLLEELMSAGLLRLMIATGTVAAGVDFPARTVVITAHSKRGAEGFAVLASSELQQMSGRAGRRGKDTVGICLVAPSQYCDARVIAEVAKRPPEALRSAYFAAPATMLNLLKYRNVDDLRYTVGKSLASFLDAKSANTLRSEARSVETQAMLDTNLDRKPKTEKRAKRMYRDADRLQSRQLDLLDRSLSGLEKLGHIANGSLTEKGIWSAELCTSLILELAEGVDCFLFSECDLETLVGLVASIAGDPHRAYFSLRRCPVPSEKLKKLEEVVRKVSDLYVGSPFANEVAVQPDAATTVLTWLHAQSWQEFSSVLKLAGVADGDAARLISQTADHLNQLSRLKESHPELARIAQEARTMLLRPPITDAYEVGLE